CTDARDSLPYMRSEAYLVFARTSSRIIARAGGAGLAAAVAAGLVLAAQTTSGAVTPHGSIGASTQFYVDPNSQVQRWDAANPADSREPAIAQRIGAVPQGIWFSNYRPTTVTT